MAASLSVMELRALLKRLKSIQSGVSTLENAVAAMKTGDLTGVGQEKVATLMKHIEQKKQYLVSLTEERRSLLQQQDRLNYIEDQLRARLQMVQVSETAPPVNTSVDDWGEHNGKPVQLVTLSNSTGMTVKITNYGATITSVETPDRTGQLADVVTGFDDFADYLTPKNRFFGCIAGRYANRIAKGKFTLNGQEYTLVTNNGPNALHGGSVGFNKKVFDITPVEREGESGFAFSATSAHMEEGYPGNMEFTVTYLISAYSNTLTIEYSATTDQDTVLNLTNHSYFNLSGNFSEETLFNHELQLNCSNYLPIDNTSIPLGEPATVVGTPFDFTTSKLIGQNINDENDVQIKNGSGYDHNYCSDQQVPGELFLIARVFEATTGRTMNVETTEPGVQLYTGNFLMGQEGKGQSYVRRSTFCLETQHWPNTPNQPNFPSCVCTPSEPFNSTTKYIFGCR